MPLKKQKPSIKRKLFTFLALTGALYSGLIFISHSILIDYIHEELHREQLKSAAKLVADTFIRNQKKIDISDISNIPSSRYYIDIKIDKNKFYTSENIKPSLDLVGAHKRPGIFHIPGENGFILGYNMIFKNGKQKISITIIEKNSYIPSELKNIHTLIWIVSFTILFAISTIIFLGVTIALKPLKLMSAQLTSLKKGERNSLDENVPEEFNELVKHLNRLLESYDKKLSRSRHLAADISHSLKTPLSAINSMINDEAIPRTIASQIKSQLSEMHELIDTQMRKTEMSGQHIGKATPIIEKALALVDVVSRIYPYKQIYLRETIPREVVWPIDERDFNEILGNVLDNAGKWCVLEVHLHLKLHDDTLTILVEDDGPGVASYQLPDLTRRQKRLDEKTPGYGLGLSIVEEIVHDYAGAIHFSTSPKGGLRVLIELPKSV